MHITKKLQKQRTANKKGKLMKYFHHSAISTSLFHFVFHFEYWQTFDTPFLSGFVPLKNGSSFQYSPGLRTRHCQVRVERSSAVSSNYRWKRPIVGFAYSFPTRDSKQQMEIASGRQGHTNWDLRVPLQFKWRMGKFRRTSSSETIDP